MSRITVDIRKGDITRVKTAAIVNAANTTGAMVEGVSLAIRRAGGEAIEDAAIAESPIPDLGMRLGKVSPTEAARAMLDAIAATKTATLRHVVLIDVDKRLYEALRKARHGDDEDNGHPHGGPGERRLPRTQAPNRHRSRHRSSGYGR